MLKFNVAVDVSGVLRALDKLKREQREIARRTINSLAFDVRKAWQDRMQTTFNRPTRWPISGVWVTQATAANLTATIAMKEGPFKQSELLKQQLLGGGRAPKNLEVWLRQRGFLGTGESSCPARARRWTPAAT